MVYELCAFASFIVVEAILKKPLEKARSSISSISP